MRTVFLCCKQSNTEHCHAALASPQYQRGPLPVHLENISTFSSSRGLERRVHLAAFEVLRNNAP